jgi:hypothetical protein
MNNQNHRKVYAKGYFDGLQAAVIKAEQNIAGFSDMLNKSKFDRIYNNLSSIARKTYDAVPIQSAWTTQKVISEMQRNGVSSEYRIICGCLNSLIAAGLVKEVSKGEFIRTQIREAEKAIAAPSNDQIKPQTEETMPPKQTAPTDIIKPVQPVVAAKKSPIDLLGELSARMAQYADCVKTLAAEINDACIAVQADMEASAESVQKVNELRKIFQSFG